MQKKSYLLTSWTCMFLIFFTLPTLSAKAASNTLPTSINVLAPTSMTNALTRLIILFSTRGELSIAATFDASSELINTVKSGDSADLIITDYPIRKHLSSPATPMDEIHNQGLIEIGSRTNLINNALALIASHHHPATKDANIISHVDIRTLMDNLSKNTFFVIPDPDTEPAGIYFKEAMITLGYWKTLKNKLIRASDNRNALHLIAEGQGIGFVYMTDALNHDKVKVLATFPKKSHTPIVYQAAVVTGTNMALARQFLTFLSSKEAQQIFREYGFSRTEIASQPN